MRLFALIRLIFRNLIRHRRRSLIALMSVGFGIAALVIANGFIEWMFVDFREATIESQFAHIQISRPGYHENGRADPYLYLLPQDDEARTIAGVAHLRSWGPRLSIAGLVSRGEATVSFVGEGFNPATDLTSGRSLRIVQGKALSANDQKKVLLGKGLAFMLGVKAGDSVVVVVDSPKGGLNAIEVQVAGIFESVSKAYDDSTILVHIDAARRLLKVAGAHEWVMYLDNTSYTPEVSAALRSRLDPKLFEVRTWDQLAEFYIRATELFRQQLGVVRFIVIAIILLSIGNTMMMSVMERTGEIGTAIALGIKRRAVLGQFLLEGALIGLLGGIVGLVAAFFVGAVLDQLKIEMPPPPGMTMGYVARILLSPAIVSEAMIVAVLTTTLASLYPAWKASRMIIVDAIRHNR